MLLVAAACSQAGHEEADTVSIIPQPRYVQMDEGTFRIDKDTKIFLDEPVEEYMRIAGFLNERLLAAAGFSLEITDEMTADGNVIFFMNAGLPSEAYGIHVEPDRIVIDYGDGAGAFYALQTIFQLLPEEIFADSRQRGVKWEIPCLAMEDAPRFKYRGMHLDVCLHYFDVDFLKKYIDIMALHKVNRFHWHLTEDQGWRLEIKKYPLLTEKGQWRKETVVGSLNSGVYDGTPYGGYYSQEQVRE